MATVRSGRSARFGRKTQKEPFRQSDLETRARSVVVLRGRQSSRVNTIIRRPRQRVAPPTLLSEIEGYTALGMKSEALALCRRALQLKRRNGRLLCAVVDSVQRLAVQRRRWMPALEAAFARLNARDQRQVRFSLLFLEAELKRSAQVLRLAPRMYRGGLGWLELALVAEAALATREWQLLRAISGKLQRATEETLDEECRAWMEKISARIIRAEKRVVSPS
jgi:hypothetical protein